MRAERSFPTRLVSRAAMLFGALGLLLSLVKIAALVRSGWRVEVDVEDRFRAHAAVSGAMVGIPATISIRTFFLDETEVTVLAYRACVDGGGCTAPSTGGFCNWGSAGRDDHPVNCVDWFQAEAFCGWAGKRLPGESEWELGGCGVGEGAYPWGREAPEAQDCFARGAVWEGRGAVALLISPDRGTCPVREHAKSPRGLFGMGGNVAEWTTTEFRERPESVGSRRPVHAGVTWADPRSTSGGKASPFACSTHGQHAPSYRSSLLGFRCARDGAR